MSKTWFTAKAGENDTAEIAIYDEIGLWGVTAKNFRDSLKALGTPKVINLSINSPGGNVFDGIAIHNMLARHKARVVVTVDGIAASIASVIAMAGDEIVMPENAMMMIHNPEGVVVGQSKDMREIADALDKIREAIIASYGRTGLDRDELVALLDAETWMTAQEAVDQGFADRTTERVKIAARFDLGRFVSPPENLRAKPKKGSSMSTKPADPAAADPAASTAQTDPAAAAATAPAPAATAPAPTNAADPAKVERARVLAITDLCDLANSKRAREFIDKGMTVEEVTAAIKAERAAGVKPGGEVQTTNNSANAAADSTSEPASRFDAVAFMKHRYGAK